MDSLGNFRSVAKRIALVLARVVGLGATERLMKGAGVGASAFALDDGMLFLDRNAFRRAGVNADSVVRAFADATRRIPGVLRVDWVNELAKKAERDPIARRWIHMLPPDLSVPLVVTLRPGHVWGWKTFAQHGSPHDYDAHVPVIFYGPQFKPGRYNQFARTVDIAPTLARVLDVKPTEPLDGRVLTQAVH